MVTRLKKSNLKVILLNWRRWDEQFENKIRSSSILDRFYVFHAVVTQKIHSTYLSWMDTLIVMICAWSKKFPFQFCVSYCSYCKLFNRQCTARLAVSCWCKERKRPCSPSVTGQSFYWTKWQENSRYMYLSLILQVPNRCMNYSRFNATKMLMEKCLHKYTSYDFANICLV